MAPAKLSGVEATIMDDWDSWCETEAICHRNPDGNKYIEETKGNGTWGDQSGVRGSFDIIIRTNLNGRQPRWTSALIWDSGEAVWVGGATIECWEEISLWPDNSCGYFEYPETRAISPGNARLDSGLIYGNYLVNSNDYYSSFVGYFNPDSDPDFEISIPPLESTYYNCPRNDICMFY
ncbi:hypothetical protein GCM10029964_091260 [Kibdelosporangium lantanae]